MTGALAPVVERLFDDASLFPPASLPMPRALADHDRLRRDPATAPMVGPFLYPASRFDELEACLASGLARPPELGIIAYGGDAPWATIYATPGVVQVEAPQSARPPEPPRHVRRYVELPRDDDRGDGDPADGAADDGGAAIPAGLAAALDRVAASGARAKLRCGGPTAADVPSCRWLAAALVGCAERGLTLKATAGLHEPFRGKGPDGPQHGLVNLLAAAGAARRGADAADVAELLAITEDGDTADLVAHAAGARALLHSVGTCSIDETVEGLRSRGLL